MGTRGAFGFIVNGKEKVTYNHFDSYPCNLGKDILEFLVKYKDLEAMRQVAEAIHMVGSKKPTKKQQAECIPFMNLEVSERTPDDWYCLLRNAQGSLEPYMNGLHYMISSKEFLKDSLFCEYAYIINLDDLTLEYYEGFNKRINAAGRYAKTKPQDHSGEYYGVALKLVYDLKGITTKKIPKILEQMEKEDKPDYKAKGATSKETLTVPAVPTRAIDWK